MIAWTVHSMSNVTKEHKNGSADFDGAYYSNTSQVLEKQYTPNTHSAKQTLKVISNTRQLKGGCKIHNRSQKHLGFLKESRLRFTVEANLTAVQIQLLCSWA